MQPRDISLSTDFAKKSVSDPRSAPVLRMAMMLPQDAVCESPEGCSTSLLLNRLGNIFCNHSFAFECWPSG